MSPEECCDPETQIGIAPALLARARAAEARMPGDPVPEEAWRILAGEQGGAIAWAHHRRMLECLDLAAARRPIRCDAA